MSLQSFVIVTGLSGAGKSQAMKSFEDLGYYCLDNLPPNLSMALVALVEQGGIHRVAIALDVRTHGPFGDPLAALDGLTEAGFVPELLFLDADDEALVRRYSETRRRHPFATDADHLTVAIGKERASLAPLRARAQHVWDTSGLTHGMLKERIQTTFLGVNGELKLRVALLAFGFKFGVPLDADCILDVRFLPNPHYVAELRPLTGDDAPVAAYLEALPETAIFLEKTLALLDFLMPQYRKEGKSQLTIAIGCTGGRHRSVYLMRRIAMHLQANPTLAVSTEQRDVER